MTVYANFPNKRRLFEAVIQQESTELGKSLSGLQAVGPDIRAQLIAFGCDFIAFQFRPDVRAFNRIMAVEGGRASRTGKGLCRLRPQSDIQTAHRAAQGKHCPRRSPNQGSPGSRRESLLFGRELKPLRWNSVFLLVQLPTRSAIMYIIVSISSCGQLESVRKHQVGLHSFRSMRRIEARRRNASALRLRFSQSLASLRQRLRVGLERMTTKLFTRYRIGGGRSSAISLRIET